MVLSIYTFQTFLFMRQKTIDIEESNLRWASSNQINTRIKAFQFSDGVAILSF